MNESVDTFLFDCDGVLWHDNHLIEGAVETLQLLHEKGKRVLLVTNNSTSSRSSYLSKVKGLGLDIPGLGIDSIFGSAYSAAFYLRCIAQLPLNKSVYVIGQSGIVEEIQGMGYTVVKDMMDTKVDDVHFTMSAIHESCKNLPETVIGAVVIGFDLHFSYRKLTQAFRLLHGKSESEIIFIATNQDSTYPSTMGIFPGTGSFVASLATCSGRDPVITGKPSATLFQCIREKYLIDPAKTCMVGDRLDTDIAFGRDHGCKTVLVLTGISQESDIAAGTNSIIPDFIVPSIKELPSIL